MANLGVVDGKETVRNVLDLFEDTICILNYKTFIDFYGWKYKNRHNFVGRNIKIRDLSMPSDLALMTPTDIWACMDPDGVE